LFFMFCFIPAYLFSLWPLHILTCSHCYIVTFYVYVCMT
jgi:hypothetical protein